jgi:uncharacterized CHY-type Zn-finger protein
MQLQNKQLGVGSVQSSITQTLGWWAHPTKPSYLPTPPERKIKDGVWVTEDWHSHQWKRRPCFKVSRKQWQTRWSSDLHVWAITCVRLHSHTQVYICTHAIYTHKIKQTNWQDMEQKQDLIGHPKERTETESVTNKSVPWTTVPRKAAEPDYRRGRNRSRELWMQGGRDPSQPSRLRTICG